MRLVGGSWADVFLVGVLVTATFVACERTDRDLAGVKRSRAPENPPYTAVADEGSSNTKTTVAAVLPEGEPVLDGKALFASNCAACHQVTGTGVPSVFPPLNKSHYVTSDNIERIAAISLYGLHGEIEVNGTKYNSVMAPLGGVLDDKKLAAILTYIRGAWDNKAGAVAPEAIAATRKKWGTRGFFKIEELGTGD